MSNDRSIRTLFAVLFITAALMVATNYAIAERAILDWWLPALLAVIGVVLALPIDLTLRRPVDVEESTETALALSTPAPTFREYNVSALPKTPPAPRTIAAPSAPVTQAAPVAQSAAPQPEPPTLDVVRDPALEPSDFAHDDTPETIDTPSSPRHTTADQPLVSAAPDDVPVAVTPEPPAPDAEPPSLAKVTLDVSAQVGDTSAAIAATPGAVITVQDLVRIDGIGPRIAGVLIDAGIDTFEKLAGASEADLRETLSKAGIRLAPSINTWAEQAAYAARGDWAGMDAFNAARK